MKRYHLISITKNVLQLHFLAKELDNIERIALSIGMILALVPIAGLLLNYTHEVYSKYCFVENFLEKFINYMSTIKAKS